MAYVDLPSFAGVPTLIIHGTDKTVPIEPSARAAARGIGHAKLIEYDGEPHGLFASTPERLNGDLLEFLGSGGEQAACGHIDRQTELT
jgi:non-heme chloroperoxidase